MPCKPGHFRLNIEQRPLKLIEKVAKEETVCIYLRNLQSDLSLAASLDRNVLTNEGVNDSINVFNA